MHYTPAERAYIHTQARARALQLRHEAQLAAWQGLRAFLRQSLARLHGSAQPLFAKRHRLAHDVTTSPKH